MFTRRCIFANLRPSLCVIAAVFLSVVSVPAADPPNAKPDSFKYYGPGKLRSQWDLDSWQPHRIGRDSWFFWTWGNQKFLRFGSKALSSSPVPVSLDLFRLLDSRQRDTRFARLGLINEPNCRKAERPNQYGLWLDEWDGDPEHYYPGDPAYDQKQHYPGTTEVVDTRNYGRPSGVIGIRLFDNPKFDPKQWDVKQYFKSPGTVEPPVLIGFTCALCHIAFDPTRPPKNPEQPRWENLAANIGNQYLREGELIFTKGRVLFGDQRPGPNYATDPYDTKGIGPDNFLYHYAETRQPGTSETSRISYDFINNPNTMNAIFNLGHRRTFSETNPQGKPIKTRHILKDGADSVGVEWALMRVPINIGCEGVYWSESLFNPFSGERQHPFRIAEALNKLPDHDKKKLTDSYGIDFSQVKPERIQSLKLKYKDIDGYGQEFGSDWAEAWKRNSSLAAYLASYEPFALKDAEGGNKFLSKNETQLKNGQLLFADHCARCHSNIQPAGHLDAAGLKKFYRDSVTSTDFLEGNTLTDDVRYSVAELGTNMARAIATNAIEDDVWAEFSSNDYKLLPNFSKYPVELKIPVFPGQPPIPVSFRPPAAGRGYYRTPSLVSVWATAPFFHNNSLGSYSGDVSVAGRIRDFEDAMTKLLSPEKRQIVVKRTSQDSTLVPDLSQALPKFLSQRIATDLRSHLEKKISVSLADTIVRELQPVLEKTIAKFLSQPGPIDMSDMQLNLPDRMLRDLAGPIQKLEIPESALGELKVKLLGRVKTDLSALSAIVKANALTIPEGTPVNLYANLNLESLPTAIAAHLMYPKGSRELAEALLRASSCPDLVEDKGHLYGQELSAQDKRDLIEFLKTL